MGNFEEAHTLFEPNKPDIVLSDIKLENDESGIEIVKNLKMMSDFCVIYLTSYGDDAMIEKALSTNPAAYITKPFKEIDFNAELKLVATTIKNKNTHPDFCYNKETRSLFYKNEQIVLSKQTVIPRDETTASTWVDILTIHFYFFTCKALIPYM
ncbi:response regulator [Sulfurospirillum halorespirans]|uniref:Response regulator n=1 Tax=Sulfurospirillum halorespirans DSM 13726 TaxID=1193502 RepID=A0A1D7TJ81_9BACT|nr:response regulator [Sulfurospirillum halorespirans DSM 13726]